MATEVYPGIIEGHTLRRTLYGWEGTQVSIVKNPGGDQATALYWAMMNNDVPQYLEPWPTGTLGAILFVQDILAEPVQGEPQIIKVTAVYRGPQGGTPDPVDNDGEATIAVGSTVQPLITTRDRDGNEMKVEHTYEWEEDNEPQSRTDEQVVEADINRPLTTLSFTRREVDSPGDRSLLCVGKVNSSYFHGGNARTWLCTKIMGTSIDLGLTYNVAYEFQRAPLQRFASAVQTAAPAAVTTIDTWDAVGRFIDPDTGRPIIGAQLNVEERTWAVYDEIDFAGALSL